MCVQRFTVFELAVLKLYNYLGEFHKIMMATISMATNRGENNYFVFFSIIVHTDHNKYTMKLLGWRMSKTNFPTSTSPACDQTKEHIL